MMRRHVRIRRVVIGAVALAAGLFLAAVPAAGQYVGTIRAPYDAELALTVLGRVEQVHVQPGETVEAGRELVKLDDTEPQARLALHRRQAEDETAVKLAQHRLERARAQVERLSTASKSSRKRSSDTELLERARSDVTLAELELALAQAQHEQAKRQLELTRALVDQYTLRAPSAGVVEQVMVLPGQVVQPGRPVVRLMRTDTLWVDADIPTDQTVELKLNDPVWIRPRQPGGAQPIRGRIVFLSQAIDTAMDTRTVRVEIANDAGLFVGGLADVDFEPPPATAATTEP